MKRVIAFLLPALFSLTSLAHQLELPLKPQQCLSHAEAQDKIAAYLIPLVGQAPLDDFDWITEDDVITSKDVVTAVNTLLWSKDLGVFVTNTLVYGYCAPGAQCWGWYTVDCNGHVIPEYIAEE